MCEEGKGRTLGFENTLPAFLIFLTGVALCFVVLLCELGCSGGRKDINAPYGDFLRESRLEMNDLE